MPANLAAVTRARRSTSSVPQWLRTRATSGRVEPRYAARMASFVRVVALASPLFVSACGPTTSSGDEGAASTSSGTGAPSCEMYGDAPGIGPAVAITVRHEGTTPVFFRPTGCGGSITVEIRQSGETIPWLVDYECSPSTCEQFVAASDCSIGCNDCAPPQAGRIDAGAVGDANWPGNRTTELALEEACAPAADCPATCLRRDQAEPGAYEVALTVFRTCTGTCTCDGPGAGVCSLWNGDEQLADPVTFTAALDYPSETAVEIAITD